MSEHLVSLSGDLNEATAKCETCSWRGHFWGIGVRDSPWRRAVENRRLHIDAMLDLENRLTKADMHVGPELPEPKTLTVGYYDRGQMEAMYRKGFDDGSLLAESKEAKDVKNPELFVDYFETKGRVRRFFEWLGF